MERLIWDTNTVGVAISTPAPARTACTAQIHTPRRYTHTDGEGRDKPEHSRGERARRSPEHRDHASLHSALGQQRSAGAPSRRPSNRTAHATLRLSPRPQPQLAQVRPASMLARERIFRIWLQPRLTEDDMRLYTYRASIPIEDVLANRTGTAVELAGSLAGRQARQALGERGNER